MKTFREKSIVSQVLVNRQLSDGSVNFPHIIRRNYPQYPVMRNPLQMGMEPVTISNGKVNDAFQPDSPPQYNGVKAEVQVSLAGLSL